MEINGQWRIRQFPADIPPFWLKITSGRGIMNYVQKRDWPLVLNARDIPYELSDFNGQSHIYVPLMQFSLACREIKRYEQENSPVCPYAKEYAYPFKKSCLAIFFLFIPIILYFFNNAGRNWFDWLPAKGAWIALGCLDSADILLRHQWQRIFTALTLHADLRHLCGNLFFGGLFFVLLGRLIGAGRAILFCVLAAGLANFASVLVHTLNYRSAGLSTAIFASLGIMAGVLPWRATRAREWILPLGGALGLLGLLGTEGENSDYAAHVFGLVTGLGMGIFIGWMKKISFWLPGQKLSAFLAIFIIGISWFFALKQFFMWR